MRFLRKLRLKLKTIKAKLLTLAFGVGTAIWMHIPIGFCADTTSSIITDWMPTIVSFAMLGMVLGLVRKYAK